MIDADLSRMLMIRAFERKLLDLFGRGLLNGTTHTCLGQEYVPVAVEGLLDPADHVFSNHRGHGHYLARFDDPEGLLAEIMGREGAVCSGVGGSQHIRRDRYLSTGVQGESLPVAAGVALHLKRTEPGRLACAYIGDGTFGEGSVYEALNLAALWRLPLLVVVENNGIAQSTPTSANLAGTIEGRAAAFGITHALVEGADVDAIRDRLAPLVAAVRQGGPAVVEFVTHRLGPHSKGDDTRPAHAIGVDWRDKLLSPRLEALEAEAEARIEAVAADVMARPLSRWETR
ncbi:thiamine pyrophosphate-dependent dehydrogenase E1 component subunit alpha [Nonomuraea sp. bgisy101]|uniref:thiamine pyrophosphate-dependent dehydrogenase E1 component subunit alpha n=1 Tax=Nonomuraea sp. bgisy101 TaxID=3413784 RepID=UPI003D735D96